MIYCSLKRVGIGIAAIMVSSITIDGCNFCSGGEVIMLDDY